MSSPADAIAPFRPSREVSFLESASETDCLSDRSTWQERMAKKKTTTSRAKVKKVMHEYKEGTLKSGSGKKVSSRKQAVAVALSEARKSGARIPKKTRKG
jgi:hypothetical protein